MGVFIFDISSILPLGDMCAWCLISLPLWRNVELGGKIREDGGSYTVHGFVGAFERGGAGS